MSLQALSTSSGSLHGIAANCFLVSHVKSCKGMSRSLSKVASLPLYFHIVNATGHAPLMSKNSRPFTSIPPTSSKLPSISDLIFEKIDLFVSQADFVNSNNKESPGSPLESAASQISFIWAKKQQ